MLQVVQGTGGDEGEGGAPAGSDDHGGQAQQGPVQLVVRPWWDPALAVAGVDPRGDYAERFWLPVIGPSTLLLLRRFARGFAERPSGFRVPVEDTAKALGLGGGTGRNAPLSRTVDRACTFGLARRPAPGELEVRTHLPLLNPRQERRLPDAVRLAHDAWLEQHPRPGPLPRRPGPTAA